MRATRPTALLFVGGWLGLSEAFAAQTEPETNEPTDESSTIEEREAQLPNPFQLKPPRRILGIAELGLGWLTLPSARICNAQHCAKTDTTPLIELWNLVQFDGAFALGGGITLGLFPTTGLPIDSPSDIERSHSRSYLTIEGLARYYPIQGDGFEFWLGAGLGLIVLSDAFVSQEGQSGDSYIGKPGVTLRSEGLSVFGATGLSFALDQYWHLGASTRLGAWQLPLEPARSPFGDAASMAGTTFFVYGGLSLALRAEL